MGPCLPVYEKLRGAENQFWIVSSDIGYPMGYKKNISDSVYAEVQTVKADCFDESLMALRQQEADIGTGYLDADERET